MKNSFETTTSDFFTLPSEGDVEVTLIGTGGGYGESIVVKIGTSDWLVIDSCINPNDGGISLPLDYLTKIGVDLSTEVKLIVCTHWHEDHIRGMSNLLEKCSSAKFCISDVTDMEKFLRFVSFDKKKSERNSSSSTKEFESCLEISRKSQQKGRIKRASVDKVIHYTNVHNK